MSFFGKVEREFRALMADPKSAAAYRAEAELLERTLIDGLDEMRPEYQAMVARIANTSVAELVAKSTPVKSIDDAVS